jgi:hypothetical protein
MNYEEIATQVTFTDEELAFCIITSGNAVQLLDNLGARYKLVADDIHSSFRAFESMGRARQNGKDYKQWLDSYRIRFDQRRF